MRILLLTQYYTPEPVVKFADLARGLRERGHDVQVITGFPCYPTGRTYDGHRQRFYAEAEQPDGVLVTRVPQIPNHSRSILRRALYYVSFALSAMTIGLWRMRRVDVILVYQSALPTALAAWFMSRVKRVPYVLDVADLWPESVAASGMLANRIALAAIRACMKFAYRGAARINVITEGYRDRLIALGVPSEKITLIYYWAASGTNDSRTSDGELARREGFGTRFNIVYSGVMGPVQDLRSVVEAASLLADNLPEVQFVFIGDGLELESLKAFAAERSAENVRFLGRKTPCEVEQLSQAAEALIVHLKPDPLTRISIPSKTFSCMASGRPILMAVEGEASRLVERHQCGITAQPSEPVALAAAVCRLVAMGDAERQRLGESGRRAFRENYCSDVQIPKFERLLGESTGERRCFYQRAGKRACDLVIAAMALILLSPIMILAAAAVRFNLGSPVLFAQKRPGKHGKLFTLFKFRTMREDVDAAGRPLADAERLTRFGRFLRATSLDELPELWNVLRGDMSLVGPRPLLPDYLELYTPRQARRHDVRPGITGWAQVNGRNELAWEQRFEHDVWYVENGTFWVDCKILVTTLWQVLRRRGITMGRNATAERFTGMSSKSVVVLGAGGHAKVVISTLQAAGRHVLAAYDDDVSKHGQQILGVRVVGSIGELDPQAAIQAVIAIGDNERRRALASHFAFHWLTVIHPTAWVDPSVRIGAGSVVGAGAVIQPGSQIGRHVIVNTQAGVDHDCRVQDFAHIAPGAHLAGNVTVGSGSLVGIGASVIPGVRIGWQSVVGAGAAVVEDVPSNMVAVGCPAQVIRSAAAADDENRAFQQAG